MESIYLLLQITFAVSNSFI